MGAVIITRILTFHNHGHIPLHRCCASSLGHQHYLAVLISLHTGQHLVILSIFAGLKGEKWHLLFSFGMWARVSCLLVTCISFLFFFKNNLFIFFVYFSTWDGGLFFFFGKKSWENEINLLLYSLQICFLFIVLLLGLWKDFFCHMEILYYPINFIFPLGL